MSRLETTALMIDRLARKMWRRLAREAETMPIGHLEKWRRRADRLHVPLAEFRHLAEARLMRPRPGSNTFHKPPRTDWAWRPDLWLKPVIPRGRTEVRAGTHVARCVALHHDCLRPEIAFRQERNRKAEDLAPYAAVIDVLGFDGSYLSVTVEGQEKGLAGLSRNHILRLEILLELEAPVEIFTRLNLRHGVNVTQIGQDFDGMKGKIASEFDLGSAKFDEELLDHFWVDIIFESPAFNRIRLGDMTLMRYPRAKF